MTLVEALTQHVPLSEATNQTELVLPETIPEPFFDIASHCLRRDPQRRWTVAEITARLQRTPPASLTSTPLRKEPAEPGRVFSKWGYVAAAVAVGIVLWGILRPRPANHHPGAERAPSRVVAAAKHPPEPAQAAGRPSPVPQAKAPPPSVAAGSNAPPPVAKKVSTKNATKNSTADLVPGAVVQQVLPEVSRYSRNTIQGKVRVRVRVTVDSSGNVLVAKFDSRGPSKYFAERTLEAAKQWTFKPPLAGGQSVPSEWVLKFEIGRSVTNVHPVQTSP
jgi:TonB family protein